MTNSSPGESPKETMERLTRQFNQMSELERAVIGDFINRATTPSPISDQAAGEREEYERWFDREFPRDKDGRSNRYHASCVQDLMFEAYQAGKSTAQTTGSAPEMTNGDFHCPACGEVKKGPLFCGNCLWQAPEAVDAEIAASPAASAPVPIAGLQSIYAAMNHMGDILNNMDAVEAEDEKAVGPGFRAIRALLAASTGGEKS